MVLLITCLIVYNLIVILYDLLRYVILLYRRYLYKHKPKPEKSEVIENEDIVEEKQKSSKWSWLMACFRRGKAKKTEDQDGLKADEEVVAI